MGKTAQNMEISRIIRLQVSNVKRIEAVDITPDEHLQVIAGQNGEGKSSVLDSIAMALGGTKQAPAEPIRRGQERAEIILDLGDIHVKRIFTDKTTRVEVTTSDGKKYPSPQALLDELTGRLSFDPCEFQNMGAREQATLLQELSGVDFDKLNESRSQAYDDRRIANAELKTAKARLSAVPEDRDAPKEEVSISALAAELEEAEKVNRENEQKCQFADKLDGDIKDDEREMNAINEKIFDLKSELQLLKIEVAGKREVIIEHKQKVAALQDVDAGVIRASIAGAEDINRRARVQKERIKLVKEMETQEAEAARLNKLVNDIDKEKAQALADAKMPVKGLGLNEDGVTFNDMPFDQCSCSERLRVSVAMGIALNPKLKLILIRAGNDLDDNSLDLVKDMVIKAGCQCWLEKIDPGATPAVYIENGKVKEAGSSKQEMATVAAGTGAVQASTEDEFSDI